MPELEKELPELNVPDLEGVVDGVIVLVFDGELLGLLDLEGDLLGVIVLDLEGELLGLLDGV